MRQMKTNQAIMKNTWKTLLIIPLLLVIAAAPVSGRQNNHDR